MAELPAKEALSGPRLDESKSTPTTDVRSQPGTGAEKGSAFNAALSEGGASSRGVATFNGQEGALRPDLLTRTDGAARSDGSTRPGTLPTSEASILSGLKGEGLDIGTVDLPVLRLGASDAAVGLLQRALAVLGYLTMRSEAAFDAGTDQAVRSFQEGSGIAKDGVVGNRETWPAINKALVTRHEGVTRLADAMGSMRSVAEPQIAEMKQLNSVLIEFGERTTPPVTALSMDRQGAGDVIYTARGGETLADVARIFGLPASALIAANPELAKPYLILQGQLLIIPNPVKERTFRRRPRQLHPADPEGYLASANMNPGFVDLVNGMIGQLRGENHDVRVIAGFRSFGEQQQRFEQGRRSPGSILTDAEGGQSWHNYGLAVDIVLNDEDGGPTWPEDNAIFWQRLGDVALAHGAVWGGLFGYPAHVEYHPQLDQGDAGSLIEDFESHGLEAIWERIALQLPPEV